jgi:hypothetical protein
MLRKTFSPIRPRRATHSLTVAVLGCAVLLAGCQTPPKEAPPPPVVTPAPPPPPPAPLPPPQPQPEVDPTDAATRRFLGFHEYIRQMPAPELAQEISRLSGQVQATATAASPAVVLELALALSQQHNGSDLGRAIALLDPISRSSAAELRPWQPLARLLQARVVEQRRLEEQVDRQGAQLRDAQRNVQQLNEKLEALKAIERSLNARPPQAPAPASMPSK